MTKGRFTTDDDVQIDYTVEGVGPPLVLCHGGPGLWDDLADLAHLLVDRVTVIRWHQRGCGASDPVGPYTLERSVADLTALRHHLGHDRWVVGGHAFGATLALHASLADPDAAAALVLASSTGIGRSWVAPYRMNARKRRGAMGQARLEELGRLPVRDTIEEQEFRTLAWMPDFTDPSTARDHAAVLAASPWPINWAANAALNAEVLRLDEDEVATTCGDLDVPTLLLHGGADPRPVEALGSLLTALPHSRLVTLGHAGHRPWVECPEHVRAHLTGFLDRIHGRHHTA